MRHGDPEDPLLRQVLSVPQELLPARGYVADPLEETAARGAPGLLQKYQGRALLMATSACAVHCRYCFRRHYDYAADQAEDQPRWNAALSAIAADDSLDEIILSGGDPLSLGNARLAQLLDRLASMPQLRRIRIHTRTPIVLPSRVDAGLRKALLPHREKTGRRGACQSSRRNRCGDQRGTALAWRLHQRPAQSIRAAGGRE